ncbi:MAG: type II secretion system F family protein [Rhodocyclales bacterium]|nr:type II secretion system F family protein [Rhodocyclales bacterium]
MVTKTESDSLRRFGWTGITQNGALLKGEIRAANDMRARVALRQRGITPIKLVRPWRRQPTISRKAIGLILRQLATLIHAGVPLLAAMELLAKSQEHAVASQMLLQIRTDLQMGSSLAQAMQQHPEAFDVLTCTLVAAGEQSGLLDVMLERIASYHEKMQAIKGKIRSALAYPIAILGIAFIVSLLLLWLVVPAFEQSFASFGAALPWPTQLMIDGSNALRDYGLLFFGLIGSTGFALYRQWQANLAWQTRTDGWLLGLPILGSLFQKAALARWSQTLASLISAGIPLLDALGPAGDTAGNRSFIDASRKIRLQLQQGASLSVAMRQQAVFSALPIQMVAIGEESGSLDDMLRKVADIYEREVSDLVSMLNSLLEPLMMVVLGLIIGGMVIAMYLPIFQLGNVL